MHLSEDDLILHYYGEDEAAEHGAESHLAQCAGCREAFQGLRRVMEAIDAAPVPEPAADFERSVWARLAPALEPIGSGNSTRMNFPSIVRKILPGWNFRSLSFAGGLAAVIVGILLWQFDIRMTRSVAETEQLADADSHRERVLLTAVSDHIEQSELVLVELANAAPQGGDLDVSLERSTAGDLVSAGRLYRETARETGDLHLASLLEELELVLVEIARGPKELSAEELDAVRAQIAQQELIFKLRVLAADVKARQQSARPNPGPSKRTL